jgi:hypothetical protein
MEEVVENEEGETALNYPQLDKLIPPAMDEKTERAYLVVSTAYLEAVDLQNIELVKTNGMLRSKFSTQQVHHDKFNKGKSREFLGQLQGTAEEDLQIDT